VLSCYILQNYLYRWLPCQYFILLMMVAWRPKHVEKVCSNKISASCCITLVFSFNLILQCTETQRKKCGTYTNYITYCEATIKAKLLISARASFVVPPSFSLINQRQDGSIHFNTQNAPIGYSIVSVAVDILMYRTCILIYQYLV